MLQVVKIKINQKGFMLICQEKIFGCYIAFIAGKIFTNTHATSNIEFIDSELCFLGKPSNGSNVHQLQSKKVITNKTVLPPVVVKQEYACSNNKQPRLNNNIPSHLDVPKKLPSAKKSPPPEIKAENNGIKIEGKLT